MDPTVPAPVSAALELGDHRFCRCLGRRRVLTRDEFSVGHDVRLPVGAFAVFATVFDQHVLHQKRHSIAELCRVLFAVGEAGDMPPADQGLLIACLGVAKHRRGVANGSHRLACGIHRFDQLDGVGVFGKIPKRAVATRKEHRVEVFA